jgi:hypothetical protein
MITIYSTARTSATDTAGTKIKVRNLRTGKSRLVPWDYSVNDGLDQHEHAVWQSAAGAVSVTMGGETTHGYLFAVESEDQ